MLTCLDITFLLLADGSDQLIESNVVSEYLDRKYGDAGSKLFPDDPYKLAKVGHLHLSLTIFVFATS